VIFLKDRLKIDDAFDVSSVHGIAGIIGSLAIGIFASTLINPTGPNGLLFGNIHQLLIQAIDVGVAGTLGFVGTFIIMKVLDVLIGVRVSAETEEKAHKNPLCRIMPLDLICEANDYDKEKYREMLLEAAETVLGYFGFDRTVYWDSIRKKNRKWLYELTEERRKDVEAERDVHDG